MRIQQRVPGHQSQVDVKFLTVRSKGGKPIKRYKSPAIDGASRVWTLEAYSRHTQADVIALAGDIIRSFPFRIPEPRTDDGHEVRASFHEDTGDLGRRHVCIKPTSPQLSGNVEHPHHKNGELPNRVFRV